MSTPQTKVEPVVVYPNSVSSQAPPTISQSHHSGGSFATVFIVLAVIVVISAIACFLGRLCSRRMVGRTKPASKPNHNNFCRPKGQRDMELGFDERIPTAKPTGPGHGDDHSKGFKIPENIGDPRGFRSMHQHHELDPMGFRMPGNYGDPTVFRMPGSHDDGDYIKGETKPVDDGVLKADAYDMAK